MIGKQEVAPVISDPMKYKPMVIHRARKVESFIEKTEPRLVQQLDSWGSLRIELAEKLRAEENQRAYQEELRKKMIEKKPKRLSVR